MKIDSFYEFSRLILGDLPQQFQFLNAIFAFIMALVFFFVICSMFIFIFKACSRWL